PPLVVSHDSQSKNTLVQRAWPTHADGSYHPPETQPIAFAEFFDPDRFRPLPWSRLHWHQGLRVGGLLEMLTLLVFLGTFLHWIREGKWRRAVFYMVLAGLIAFAIGALILHNPASRLEADERYSWEGWY